ncbi:Guanine nucleotide-binding protein subunit beta-like protein [Venturia inaequalis]|nr:Guanine nucleotide-binding protein subunit beta-like protein [Venturia inaequalis]
MKIQTIFLLIGTAAALVPRMEQSSAVGNAFDIAACSGAGGCCGVTCNSSCCSPYKCKRRLEPGTSNSYEDACL